MIKINLLPYREERKKADTQRQIVVATGVCLIFFLIAALFQFVVTLSIGSYERDVKASEQQLAILVKITGDIDKFKKDKETLEKKIAVIDNLEIGRTLPVHILEELSANVPVGKVWIMAFKKIEDKITIEGVALDNPAIAQFMRQLEQSSYLESVDLISSEQTTISDVKLMNFTLSCVVERG